MPPLPPANIPVHLSIISWDDLWQISCNPRTSDPGEEGAERAGIFYVKYGKIMDGDEGRREKNKINVNCITFI